MQTIQYQQGRRRRAFTACVVLLTGTLLVGCGGDGQFTDMNIGSAPAGPDPSPTVSPATAQVNEWIDMIEEAGLTEYAQLGRELLAQGKVRIVSPPTLDAGFNAFAWIDIREIWLNTPMFERYPDVLDQATIFLHELIHIRSGECTHRGPWWSAQDEFRVYYRDTSTTALAFDATDSSIRVAAFR